MQQESFIPAIRPGFQETDITAVPVMNKSMN
jgi:hypothetical protein